MSEQERVATQLITKEVLAQLAEAVGVEVPLAELLAGGVTQKTLSYRVDCFQRQKLVDQFSNSVRDLARLNSLTMPQARVFLNAIPNTHTGTFLRSDEWRVNVLYSLGQDIYPPGTFCSACHRAMCTQGHHTLGCTTGGETLARHHALREGLIRLGKAAGHLVTREERNLLPGTNRIPGDLVLKFQGKNGADLVADVTVVSSLKDDVIERGAVEVGWAAATGEHRKERLVGAACRAQNLDFVPISVESLGGFTPTAIKVIRKLATQKAQRNNSDVKRTINQEFKKLNILLMRGNGSLLLNRFQADSVPQEEILEDL